MNTTDIPENHEPGPLLGLGSSEVLGVAVEHSGCWARAHQGQCCCTCRYQMLAMRHPWNDGNAKGQISEVFGTICASPELGLSKGNRRITVFSDRAHGLCELHEFATPNVAIKPRRQASA